MQAFWQLNSERRSRRTKPLCVVDRLCPSSQSSEFELNHHNLELVIRALQKECCALSPLSSDDSEVVERTNSDASPPVLPRTLGQNLLLDSLARSLGPSVALLPSYHTSRFETTHSRAKTPLGTNDRRASRMPSPGRSSTSDVSAPGFRLEGDKLIRSEAKADPGPNGFIEW